MKTFYLVFVGFYNLLTTNYRYQGANWDGNIFETHTKLLQLLNYFLWHCAYHQLGDFSCLCVSEKTKRVTDIAWLRKLLNG